MGNHWYDLKGNPHHTYTNKKGKQSDTTLREARKHGWLPSVTTVTQDILKNEVIERWKQKMAILATLANPQMADEDERAYINRIIHESMQKSRDATDFGSEVHHHIEQYNLDQSYELSPTGSPFGMMMTGILSHWKDFFRENVEEVVSAERRVACPEIGVAGTVDLYYVRKGGILTIGDYKGFPLDTKIPTPAGWSSIGEIKVGDSVFDEMGKICSVTGKSKIKEKHCYEIVFDDGSSVECDDEHIWRVRSSVTKKEYDFDVKTLKRELDNRKGGTFIIESAKPLNLPPKKLSIDPYLLGFWLGDGAIEGDRIFMGETKYAVEDYVKSLGYKTKLYYDKGTSKSLGINGLTSELRSAGLYRTKRVPPEYMRASVNQRLSLLQGLMDSDGSWNIARNQAIFGNTNKTLRDSVFELVVSLGMRAYKYEYDAHGFGVTVRNYLCIFTPKDFNVFKFNTKNFPLAQKNIKGSNFCWRRGIKSIEIRPKKLTQCISVSSESNLYLVSEYMIPTHNTQGVSEKYGVSFYETFPIQLALYARMIRRVDGLSEDPRISSMVINSNKAEPIYEKFYTVEEQQNSLELGLSLTRAWFLRKNYTPPNCDLYDPEVWLR